MKYPSKLIDMQTHGNASRSALIKTIKNTPAPPIVERPNLDCSTSKNWRNLTVSEIDSYEVYFDQRYAVEIKGVIYNGDHAVSIVGDEFQVGEYALSIPQSSENYVTLYMGDNEDTNPVMVRLIPSPNQEYNRIYGVDSGYQGEASYTDRNSDIFFCMTPNKLPRQLTCVGATGDLKLNYVNQNYNSDGMPIAPDSMWYAFELNDLYYFNHNFSDSETIAMEEFTVQGSYNAEDNSLNISVSSTEGTGKDCRLVMKNYVDYVNSSYLDIEESSNPTCFFSDTSGSIHACLLTSEFQISCAGATDYLAFSVKERFDEFNYNHPTLVYNISVDGVDYGEHDLAGNEVQLGHMTLQSYVSSDGNGNMYASTAGGGEPPARFVFTPRADMVDANFWGVDEESNPTVVYNAEKRSINVCLTFSANAV